MCIRDRLIYYIVPFRAKNISLLIFSLLFYWWNKPSYIFLILLSITINYLGGILLSRIGKKRIRRITLICILTANIGLLIIFKYTDFIITTVNQITHGNIALTGIIPVSYTHLDVYKRQVDILPSCPVFIA